MLESLGLRLWQLGLGFVAFEAGVILEFLGKGALSGPGRVGFRGVGPIGFRGLGFRV